MIAYKTLMRNSLTLIHSLLMVLLINTGAFSQSREIYPDLVERTTASVVLVVTYDKDGKGLSRGTGFFISSNRIITNYHVVKNALRTEIQTSDRKKYRITNIDSVGSGFDLALLQTEQIDTEVKSLPVATVLPRVGDRVLVIGNPLGLTGSVSDGIVSAFRTVPTVGKLIQITAPISPGSSGSPVINLNGEVIGVATSNLEDGQNLNFAVSSLRIRDLWPSLLSAKNVGLGRAPLESDRWRQLLGENVIYDTETMTRKLGIISAWIQYKEPDGRFQKVLTELDCNTSQIRQIRSIMYDTSGDTIGQDEHPSSWKGFVPDSNGEAFYKIFCKDEPDAQSLRDWNHKNDLIEQGSKLLESKDYEGAIAVYDQLIREFPTFGGYGYFQIGLAKREQNKLDEAKTAILKASELEDSGYYFETLGDIYFKENNISSATAAYWRALRAKDEKYFSAQYRLKEIYLGARNFEGLADLFKFLIAKGKIDKYDDLADAYEKQGLISLAQSTRLKGIGLIEQQISNGKADAFAFVSLANLYAATKNHTKRKSILVSGFKRFPKNFSLASMLAKNYNDDKQWLQAVNVIKNALPHADHIFFKKELLIILKASYKGMGLMNEVENIEKQLSELNQ